MERETERENQHHVRFMARDNALWPYISFTYMRVHAVNYEMLLMLLITIWGQKSRETPRNTYEKRAWLIWDRRNVFFLILFIIIHYIHATTSNIVPCTLSLSFSNFKRTWASQSHTLAQTDENWAEVCETPTRKLSQINMENAIMLNNKAYNRCVRVNVMCDCEPEWTWPWLVRKIAKC